MLKTFTFCKLKRRFLLLHFANSKAYSAYFLLVSAARCDDKIGGMKIVPMKDKKHFGIAELNFTDLRTIKDACDFYGRQGSEAAQKLAEELDQQMQEISI